MSKRLVCLCNFVEEKEIIAFIKKGAQTTVDIQGLSRAGTSCGRCLPEIDALVEKHTKQKPKNQQGKLELGF